VVGARDRDRVRLDVVQRREDLIGARNAQLDVVNHLQVSNRCARWSTFDIQHEGAEVVVLGGSTGWHAVHYTDEIPRFRLSGAEVNVHGEGLREHGIGSGGLQLHDRRHTVVH